MENSTTLTNSVFSHLPSFSAPIVLFPLSLTHILLAVLLILLTILVAEQLRLRQTKKHLPGPRFVLPFLGGLIEMVIDPQAFWQRQDRYGDLSFNYMGGRLVVHSTDPEVCRKMLTHDNPEELKMKLHPNAEMILGENNIAFMQGEPHKELRKQLLPLFTRRALGTYLSWQDEIIRRHMSSWGDHLEGKEVEFRPLARLLNTLTSYRVFLGDYLDERQMVTFSKHYQEMNDGFLTFPIYLPGTALYRAVQARKIVVEILTDVARRSKEHMKTGQHPPSCLLDFWMMTTVKQLAECEEQGKPLPSHHEDFEVGSTVLDFLFASQDASTSSLVWTMAVLVEYPEVLSRVREEQERVRPNEEVINGEIVESLTYTRQVIKELLRFKTPATFVPQEAQNDFPVTSDFIAPKGSILVPSLWECTKKGYSNPHSFDPDRFSPDRAEDRLHAKSFLVFGTGAHMCLGREYAINHLTAFLSLMSTHFDWTRRKTPDSDRIFFGPTVYPWDCLITLKKRKEVRGKV